MVDFRRIEIVGKIFLKKFGELKRIFFIDFRELKKKYLK